MPLLHVQERVRDGPSKDGDVGQRHRVLRAEAEHEDVDGDQDAPTADPTGGGDHESAGG